MSEANSAPSIPMAEGNTFNILIGLAKKTMNAGHLASNNPALVQSILLDRAMARAANILTTSPSASGHLNKIEHYQSTFQHVLSSKDTVRAKKVSDALSFTHEDGTSLETRYSKTLIDLKTLNERHRQLKTRYASSLPEFRAAIKALLASIKDSDSREKVIAEVSKIETTHKSLLSDIAQFRKDYKHFSNDLQMLSTDMQAQIKALHLSAKKTVATTPTQQDIPRPEQQ